MTRMRSVGWGCVLIAVCGHAWAATLPGFFNTGVDGAGSTIATGAVDPHYKLVVSADPAYLGPDAVACFPIPASYWLANSAVSRWIAPATDENYPALGTSHPAGVYIYRFSFDLTGFDPATAVVSGFWGVDNGGRILLNGVPTAFTTTSYNPLVPFNITSGFAAAVNNLDFEVTNFPSGGSNPTGLRVEGFGGTADAVLSAPTPSGLGMFEVSEPIPNPCRAMARIGFAVPREGRVSLVVHDLAGRAVRTLADQVYPAGRFEATWDGRLPSGAAAGSGVYFADFEYGGTRVRRRIVWLK